MPVNIPLTSVLEAGIAIRTVRKRAGIRIDDFAMAAGVSKQFMTDVENGKATVQMGKVLDMLQRMGIKVQMELLPADASAFEVELSRARARRAAPEAGRTGA